MVACKYDLFIRLNADNDAQPSLARIVAKLADDTPNVVTK